MARIFITGSADGLGHLAAKSLVGQGHQVVLHARNEKRGREALAKLPAAETVVTGDLSDMDETKKLATSINSLGKVDVVIHNAGLYQAAAKEIFAVNVVAPYLLTCLVQKPGRLIYLSSGMHTNGHAKLDRFQIDNGKITYADSKLLVLMLAFATARKWAGTYSNAVDPGWVATKMGGKSAPDNLQKGYETQVMLAVSNDAKAKVSGRYFFHQKETTCNPEAADLLLQERLLELCKDITGISFP